MLNILKTFHATSNRVRFYGNAATQESPKRGVVGKNVAKKRLSVPFQLHGLTQGPPMDVELSRTDAARYYAQMQTIRRIEVAAAKLYREGVVRGFCHLYSGQEACAVGMKAAMRSVDHVISSYRVHGWTYLMGIPPLGVLAELAGARSGCSRGKGGSMHMYSANFYGGNGIVGAQVPLGTGIALANKYRKTGGVCLTLYGDGAANQGQVFEAFNMAHLWQLPVVFICENNHYGMGTSTNRAASNPKYYTRGDMLPGVWVDGMNVLAVRNATRFAIDHALKQGPLIVEMSTYRYSGHSLSDPGTSYRTPQEVQDVRRTRDPIVLFKDLCLELQLLTTQEVADIDAQVQKEVDGAVLTAKNDSELPAAHLFTDVYAENSEPKMRNVMGYTIEPEQVHSMQGKFK